MRRFYDRACAYRASRKAGVCSVFGMCRSADTHRDGVWGYVGDDHAVRTDLGAVAHFDSSDHLGAGPQLHIVTDRRSASGSHVLADECVLANGVPFPITGPETVVEVKARADLGA